MHSDSSQPRQRATVGRTTLIVAIMLSLPIGGFLAWAIPHLTWPFGFGGYGWCEPWGCEDVPGPLSVCLISKPGHRAAFFWLDSESQAGSGPTTGELGALFPGVLPKHVPPDLRVAPGRMILVNIEGWPFGHLRHIDQNVNTGATPTREFWWLGAIANTLCLALLVTPLVAGLLLAARFVRSVSMHRGRKARGLCPICAYDHDGPPPSVLCPACEHERTPPHA